jgi:hypothetical protein
MKFLTAVFLMAAGGMTGRALAADKKAFPGQAGNDNIELAATVMIDPAEIRQAVGSDLGPGFVVMRVKATNKTGETMRIGPADFTVVSRKDGDRADSLAPGQMAGGSALVVKRDRAGRDFGQQANQPGFTGVQGVSDSGKPKDDALLATLKAKELPDQETKPNGSLDGLLYFSLENPKMKSKDLALLYKGPGGHLTMEFK